MSLLDALSTPQLTADTDDYSNYQRLKYRPPTLAAVRVGLGSDGHAVLPCKLWTTHRLPLVLPPHLSTLKRTFPTPTAPFFQHLCDTGLASPVHSTHMVPFGSPTFLTYKSKTKARLICDLRQYNTRFHSLFSKPPAFQLPTLEALSFRRSSPLFFTKLDIANCFWSISLPAKVRGSFVLKSSLGLLQTRRLPFGWSWSPLLAHSFIRTVLAPLRHLLPTSG